MCCGLAAPILSLTPPGSALATPMAFLAKAKNDVANKRTNTQTHKRGEIYHIGEYKLAGDPYSNTNSGSNFNKDFVHHGIYQLIKQSPMQLFV